MVSTLTAVTSFWRHLDKFSRTLVWCREMGVVVDLSLSCTKLKMSLVGSLVGCGLMSWQMDIRCDGESLRVTWVMKWICRHLCHCWVSNSGYSAWNVTSRSTGIYLKWAVRGDLIDLLTCRGRTALYVDFWIRLSPVVLTRIDDKQHLL